MKLYHIFSDRKLHMGIMRGLLGLPPDAYLSITIMRPAMSCLIGQAQAQGPRVFSLHRHVGPDSLTALDACRMALVFCATLGIHTPSFGEAATWNHDVLVQQKQEECKKACSARCLSAP